MSISSLFRSCIFSLCLGILSAGGAIGPTIGSLLIQFTGQALSVFYLANCLHLLYSFIWFVIPKLLTKGQLELAKTRYAENLCADPDSTSLNARFTRTAQRLFSFLMPLVILGPNEKDPINTLKGWKKDFHLTPGHGIQLYSHHDGKCIKIYA